MAWEATTHHTLNRELSPQVGITWCRVEKNSCCWAEGCFILTGKRILLRGGVGIQLLQSQHRSKKTLLMKVFSYLRFLFALVLRIDSLLEELMTLWASFWCSCHYQLKIVKKQSAVIVQKAPKCYFLVYEKVCSRIISFHSRRITMGILCILPKAEETEWCRCNTLNQDIILSAGWGHEREQVRAVWDKMGWGECRNS